LERLVENPQNWKADKTSIAWLTAAIDTLKSLTYNDNSPYTAYGPICIPIPRSEFASPLLIGNRSLEVQHDGE